LHEHLTVDIDQHHEGGEGVEQEMRAPKLNSKECGRKENMTGKR